MRFSVASFALLAFVPAAFGLAVPAERRALPCSDALLIHAAGTTEIGYGIVGAPLAAALRSAGVTSTYVDYSTSAEYALTLVAGAATAERLINAQSVACPNQKFILTGYSKGAMLVHRIDLSSAVKAKVAAIVAFGDPNGPRGTFALQGLANTWPVSSNSKVLSICNNGDVFCDGGLSLPAHLAYATDGSITRAANFIRGQL